MLPVVTDMVEDFMDVFVDDFSVAADLFECYLKYLGEVLKHYLETNLILNLEKYHFIFKECIVLEQKNLGHGIQVYLARVEVIAKLLSSILIKRGYKFSWACKLLYKIYQKLLQNYATSV